MKLTQSIPKARRCAGILLVECLVYIAVFAILVGGGTAAFYFFWDHSKALIYETNDIESALRAGEGWRADVRAATGKISAETTAAGEVVRIPETGGEIIYRFESGELRREVPAKNDSRRLLPKVKTSRIEADRIEADVRGGVTGWRWELELVQHRKEMNLPLRFTFEAVQPKP
jgi:hypothetical protein